MSFFTTSHNADYSNYLHWPVDGSNDPRQSETQEDIDWVTARHIANRVVSCLLLNGRLLAGKQVGKTGAQSNERDGCDAVLQANQTAKDASQVANDGCQQSNHDQGNKEGQPTAPDAWWRNHGKD